MAATKTAKPDLSNAITFVGTQGALEVVTKIRLYAEGSDFIAEIERKPLETVNPATGQVEVTTFEVLKEKAYLHKRLIHEVFNNPCEWE